MKYAIVTLAVNTPYFDKAYRHYKEISNRFSGDFIITTDVQASNVENVHINNIKFNSYKTSHGYQPFLFNLKSLAFKAALDKGYDFILYIDSDWKILPDLTENILQEAFKTMNKFHLDLIFERPAEIGGARENPTQSFFKNKLDDYHALEHTKWDKAHVMNEQIFLIKNSWKFRYFVNRWEQFLHYSIYNNIWNYAEGFEAGISAMEAEMKSDYHLFKGIFKSCFEFYDKTNKRYIRF